MGTKAAIDGTSIDIVTIANKLSFQTSYRVLNTWLRRIGVKGDHLTDVEMFSQQKVERERHYLWLPT